MPIKPSGDRGTIKTLASSIQRNIDAMYKATYYNEPTGDHDVDELTKRINANIDNIVKYNMNTSGVPSVSKLYSRMAERDRNRMGEIEDLFGSATGYDDFYANFMQNRYLRELDDEIDAVCKYFPDLLEALEIKKEGVLSADHFSKDFMTIMAPEGIEEATHAERIKQIKKTYNLLNFVDDIYDRAAKYGEQFIYIVPYSTALSRLLTDKPKTSNQDYSPYTGKALGESSQFYLTMDSKSCTIHEAGGRVYHGPKPIILESAAPNAITSDGSRAQYSEVPLLSETQKINFQVELCRDGIIESFVMDTQRAVLREQARPLSMTEAFTESVIHEKLEGKHKKGLVMVQKDKKTGGLSIKGLEDKYSQAEEMEPVTDGLVANDPWGVDKEKKEVKVKVPGCVIANPRREHVIPIYMTTNDTCLGYYYLEFCQSGNMDEAFQGFTNVMSDTLTTLRGSQSGVNAPFNNVEASKQDEILRYIAGELSKFIDAEFVQANQDLRNEIYTILKYNDLFNTPSIDKMRITFIPPEDMIHVYFKMDKITHRGISDLDRAMLPAKLYATTYITDAIGHMVRGQDKRVYWVKQQVETNIAKVLMNTIQQLKQGNFGLRQFQSINNVLNITGKFNDLLIPTSASGDSPVQVDVIPGQQFTDNSDMKQQLREMAITNVDVPFELIQARQSTDFAMQLSMSNSKFLRKIFKRQSEYQVFLSRFVSKIYSFEFGEVVELDVQLPPPMFLTMANTNQLVTNTKEYVQSITEFELADEEDENLKAKYQDLLFRYYIGTQIDLSKHEAILRKSKAWVAAEKHKGEDDE